MRTLAPATDRQRALRGHALAVALLPAFYALHDAFDGTAGASGAIFFVLPVALPAYVGGLWPGLLATGMSAALLHYFLKVPRHSWAAGSTFDLLQLALLVTIGVLLSVLFEGLREARERAREQRRSVQEASGKLRALVGRMDAVREEEKVRIARDLHDETGQLLTALRLDLDWIEEKVGELPPGDSGHELLDKAVDASSLAGRVAEALHAVAAHLRPEALDRLGLGAALRQEVRRFQERTGIACTVRLDDLAGLGAGAETALFRVAQEALTNVARHAGALAVEVSLQRDDRAVVLRVADDGRGFHPRPGAGQGLGILGMTERLERLGGTLALGPGAPRGTALEARVPLEPARPGAEA